MSEQYEQSGSGSNTQDNGRSPAEWASLSISLTIVLTLVISLIFLYMTGTPHDAIIEVTPQFAETRQEAGNYYLPVVIENTGGATAEDVMVEVSLVTGAEVESSEMTVRFLAGNATFDATAIFSNDPREGNVEIDVLSYLNP